MTEIREKLKELLVPIAESAGAFVVDIAVRNERGGKLLQAFIDTDKGVTIEQCAEISRELARQLDLSNLIPTSYRLEVSSPGTDKPIRLLRQYGKNVGRRFRLSWEGTDPQKPFRGTLKDVKGEQLVFETDAGEVVSIDFSKIVESKVELPW
jgi:ribosome maturation factor RimP